MQSHTFDLDYMLIRRAGIVSSVFSIVIAGFACSIPVAANAQPSVIRCGSASNGLDVVATTTHPRRRTCAAAIEVANAYLQAAGKRKTAEITVKGAIWICRERHGDTNPYGECVMRKQPNEKVNLIS
ncbi:hypothetical protein G3N57_16075 [Paraburkholderia sp. Se-20369]|nr:hypothetical protein [Paraburkholderia sp. Se-20369]